MLKLNSVNGKFDIVFSGDLLLGGKQKLNFPQAGSIKRCKNTDLKSQILPKEQLRKVKPKKTGPIKYNEEEKIKKVLPPDKKPLKKTHVKEPDKNTANANDEKTIRKVLPPDKKIVRKPLSKDPDKNLENKGKTNQTGKTTNRKEIKKKELPDINKKDNTNEEPPLSSHSENILSDVSDNMFKRNTFPNGGITNNQNVGVISREDLNNMFSGFFDDNKSSKFVEAVYTQEPSSPAFHLNTSRNLTRNHQLTYEQDEYNPWGRPGCGAPHKDKNENVLPDYNSYSSPPGRQLNNREHLIRNLQHSYNEEYNPWGKPGCGAPLKDKDENVVADLKSLRTTNRAQSYPGQSKKPIEDKLQSSLNVNKTVLQDLKTSPQQVNVNFSSSSTFARGQGKSQIELEDIHKRRLKELEHQSAIKQQVEEKRRLKRLEKEREQREEQEAEERFRKEQDKLREMAEKEKQKQKEKEDKLRKKQEMLEESIKKANLEAKKVKESMKRESPKANSRQTYVQRRLHHDDDVIVPANKFPSNENLNSKTRENSGSNLGNIADEKRLISIDLCLDGNQTFTQSPTDEKSPSNYNENKYLNESSSNTRKSNTSRSNRSVLNDPSNKVLQQQTSSKESSTKNIDMNFEKERGTRNNTRNKDLKIYNEPARNPDFEHIFNDYMIPFHRTQTTDLLDNPKPILTSEMKKSAKDYVKEPPKRHPDTESQYTPDVTSARQQQILNQLHALRQGLMQKEREYVLEKYS